MTIRVIYHNGPPPFPATDQDRDAVRYQVGKYWVDAIGPAPTQADVDAILNAPTPKSDVEVLKDRVAALETQMDAVKAGKTIP
jgi:hypothetical protein